MFRTNAQHKACNTCPIAKTADIIGDSTVLVIVRDLATSAKRFSELQATSLGVSTRTLTGKLKELEIGGFVSRVKYAEFPPRVEYSLTQKGRGLLGIIHEMEQYGEKYLA